MIVTGGIQGVPEISKYNSICSEVESGNISGTQGIFCSHQEDPVSFWSAINLELYCGLYCYNLQLVCIHIMYCNNCDILV